MDDLTKCEKPSLKKAEPAKPSLKKEEPAKPALKKAVPELNVVMTKEPEEEKPEDIVPGLIVLEAKEIKFALKEEARKLLAADL